MDEIWTNLTHLPQATPWLVAVLRLAAACVLGGAIGIEREYKGKAAGLRTYMMVAAGSCLFSLLTFEVVAQAARENSGVATADPVRVINAVTSGIAFLAAGTIISGKEYVSGLTTGAGLWVAGAIGVACGIGQIPLAALATVIVLAVMTVVRWMEKRLPEKD